MDEGEKEKIIKVEGRGFQKESRNRKGKLRKMRQGERENEGCVFSEHFLCSHNSITS